MDIVTALTNVLICCMQEENVYNRPSVVGAVLQTASFVNTLTVTIHAEFCAQ